MCIVQKRNELLNKNFSQLSNFAWFGLSIEYIYVYKHTFYTHTYILIYKCVYNTYTLIYLYTHLYYWLTRTSPPLCEDSSQMPTPLPSCFHPPSICWFSSFLLIIIQAETIVALSDFKQNLLYIMCEKSKTARYTLY